MAINQENQTLQAMRVEEQLNDNHRLLVSIRDDICLGKRMVEKQELLKSLSSDIRKLSKREVVLRVPQRRHKIIKRTKVQEPRQDREKLDDAAQIEAASTGQDNHVQLSSRSKKLNDRTVTVEEQKIPFTGVSGSPATCELPIVSRGMLAKVKKLILQKSWTTLGIWFTIAARSRKSAKRPDIGEALMPSESESLVEINVRAFKIAAEFDVAYGAGWKFGAHLEFSRVLQTDDPIIGAICSGDPSQVIQLFKTGSYTPSDLVSDRHSLLSVSLKCDFHKWWATNLNCSVHAMNPNWLSFLYCFAKALNATAGTSQTWCMPPCTCPLERGNASTPCFVFFGIVRLLI